MSRARHTRVGAGRYRSRLADSWSASIRLLLFLIALLGIPHTAHAVPVLEGRTLRYEDGSRLLWQRHYPQGLGNLRGPLEVGDVIYLGVGPVVYLISDQGQVLSRADLSGPLSSLDAGGGVVRATTQYGGVTERFTLENQAGTLTVQERVLFPPDTQITEWLLRAAQAVPQADLQSAARNDPTNPFLALRQARQANAQGDPYQALNAVRRALRQTLPFPAWVQLAAQLDSAGFPAAANLALERARRDAAARGLDPQLPISRAALRAYGNPSAYLGTLLAQNRLARAEVWMAHLRELHPRFQGGPQLYDRYADLLEAQGRAGEAEEWRQFRRSLASGTLYNLGLDGLNTVRDAARLAALTLVLTLGVALLTLFLRAWPTQGQQTRELGGRWRSWLMHPLSRSRQMFIAYTTPSERLTLTLQSAALILALSGWQWANQASYALHLPTLNLGTFGGGWGNAQLADLQQRPGAEATLLSGLAAQLDGDLSTTRDYYSSAPQDACALNNLGVIAQQRGDQPLAREQYRAALSIRPDLQAAAFNLGLNPAAPELTFQRTYRPGEPRLCYPDQRSLTRATTGNLTQTLGRSLSHPLELLQPAPGNSLRLNWLLFSATLLGAALAFTLLLPRTPLPLKLARPALYRFAALLFPGSSLLDNPWGGVLLLLWAALAAALLPRTGLLGYPNLPDLAQSGLFTALIAALILTYAVNTAAFIFVELRHARRLNREQNTVAA